MVKKKITKAVKVFRSTPLDNRQEVFGQLRSILSVCSPPLTVTSNSDKQYGLISKKEGEWMGRKFKEFYFGGLAVQKKYVTLHLMSVYTHPDNITTLGPELKKCMKGKACFHITHLDAKLVKQIKKAVADGLRFYKKVKFA